MVVLVGEAPFEDTPVMTQRRIVRGEMTIPSFVSPEARDLIKKVRNLPRNAFQLCANKWTAASARPSETATSG